MNHYSQTVLGQLTSRKTASQPKTNPNPNPNPNQGGNFPPGHLPGSPLTLKLTLTLTETPTQTGGQFSLGNNCPDTLPDVLKKVLFLFSSECQTVRGFSENSSQAWHLLKDIIINSSIKQLLFIHISIFSPNQLITKYHILLKQLT